ncbi:MAG: hypothetical protein R3B90_08605 [Planctomycetaceae bacterium]
MTAAQVRATVGSDPDIVTRLSSRGQVTELWHFEAEKFTVHLQSSRSEPRLKVQRIVEERKPAR